MIFTDFAEVMNIRLAWLFSASVTEHYKSGLNTPSGSTTERVSLNPFISFASLKNHQAGF